MNISVSHLGMRVPHVGGVGSSGGMDLYRYAQPVGGPHVSMDPVTLHAAGGMGEGIRLAGGVFRDPAAHDVMPLLHEVRTGNIERLVGYAEKAGSGDIKARYILRSFVQRFSQLYYHDSDVLDAFHSACDPSKRTGALMRGVFERINREGFDALAEVAVRSENGDQRSYELIECIYSDLVEDADEPDDVLVDWLETNAPMTLVNFRAVNGEDIPTDTVPEFEVWVAECNAATDNDSCVSLDARFDNAMYTVFSEFIEVAKRDHMAYRVLGYLTTKPGMYYVRPQTVRSELNESGRLTPRAEARAKRRVDAYIASGEYHRMLDLCLMVMYGDPSSRRVMAYFCERALEIDGALDTLNAWLGRPDSLFLRRDVSQAAVGTKRIRKVIYTLALEGEQGAHRLLEALAVMGDDDSKTTIARMTDQGRYREGVQSLAEFREARSRQSGGVKLSQAAWDEISKSVVAKLDDDERIQELTPWILHNLADDGAWLHSTDARALLWDEDGLDWNRLHCVGMRMSELEDEQLIRRAMEQFASIVQADVRQLSALVSLMLHLPESDWSRALISRFDSEALRTHMEREPEDAFWVVTLAMWGSAPALEAMRTIEDVHGFDLRELRDFAKAGNEAAKRALAEMETETEDGEGAKVIPFSKP